MEIEKKYLPENPPEDLHEYPSVSIEQGYVIVTDEEELRIRKKGDSHLLTLKKGSGTTRSEVEITLTEEQYRRFSVETVGSRIHKKRFEYPLGGHIVEIDVYRGHLEGLLTAEVEFSSSDEMKEFIPPDWLGEDVSEREEFKNKNLALKGLPAYLLRRWKEGERPAWHYRQSGVVPFRDSDSGREVLLITTRKTGRWIVPKGIIEPDLSPRDSAAKEALEEAGVLGDIVQGAGESYCFEKWRGECRATLFGLRVGEILEHWAEEGSRNRKWVPPQEIGEHVENPELVRAITRVLDGIPWEPGSG